LEVGELTDRELERSVLGQIEGKKHITEVLNFFERRKISKLLQANADWLEARTNKP